MYLARQTINGKRHYFIRESFRDLKSGFLLSRDLFALGLDPARYIVYHGRYCYHVDHVVEEALAAKDCHPEPEELDDIFWPFLDPEVKHSMEPFHRRRYDTGVKKLSREEAERIRTEVHLFDKRRVYYLRFGNLDQSRVGRLPPKMFRFLLDKSRDEIEQHFIASEQILKAEEVRQYVFVVFDLQHYFTEHHARTVPHMLDKHQMDEAFLKAVCHLNSDRSFWAGMESDAWLHPYLQHYAIMFFDYPFGPSPFMDDYIRQFMDGRRGFHYPEPPSTVSADEASEIFGVGKKELEGMSKERLTKLYRSKAHEHHPDKGGEHDTFVKLTEAYNALMRGKK